MLSSGYDNAFADSLAQSFAEVMADHYFARQTFGAHGDPEY